MRFAVLGGAMLAAAAVAWLGCRPDGAYVPPAPAESPPADRLALYLTGTTTGNLEPCNCPGQPRGGLSRRETLLGTLRGRFGPGVLLDTGNMLRVVPDDLTDSYLLRGYGLLDYDAVAVGDQDLVRGPAKLAEMTAAGGVPMVSTNVSARSSSVSLAPPVRWISRQGRDVLVLGVIGPLALASADEAVSAQLTAAEPADAVRRALARAERVRPKRRPDLVVVLACLDPGEQEPVLAELSAVRAWGRGIDLVVLGGDQARPVRLERLGGQAAVYAPIRGEFVATVVFDFAAADGPRAASVQADPVLQTLPRGKELWEVYQAWTFDTQQRELKQSAKLGEIKYTASADCNECHKVQYAAWLAHPHGHAWETIVHEDRTHDTNCMRCHTTGYGFLGGFATPETTPKLKGVGCQDCHQVELTAEPELVQTPWGEHERKHWEAPKLDVAVCRTCHTDPVSPLFTPDGYLPFAACPKAGVGQPEGATTQPAGDEVAIHFLATLKSVEPAAEAVGRVAEGSGSSSPQRFVLDANPTDVLTLAVEWVGRVDVPLRAGRTIQLAIAGPAKLFEGVPQVGRRYRFTVAWRPGPPAKYSQLKVAWSAAPTMMTAPPPTTQHD